MVKKNIGIAWSELVYDLAIVLLGTYPKEIKSET